VILARAIRHRVENRLYQFPQANVGNDPFERQRRVIHDAPLSICLRNETAGGDDRSRDGRFQLT
jgi:hypothetical protein